MTFLTEYGLFIAKTITLIIGFLLLIAGIAAILNREKNKSKEYLEIKNINDHYNEFADALNNEILPKNDLKKYLKKRKKEIKETDKDHRHRIFVLNFDGDIQASAVDSLREEITAILTIATPKDEIVVRLRSSGGLISPYGLAASQLQRIKDKRIPLIVTVDEVAASGGYLMACVADQILAAPFAIIGSIGVIAQIPNFHRLLKKHDIDYEQITAGEYKRTLTMFGPNTEKGREKFKEEIEEIHELFKNFITAHRKNINIQAVATGEYWLGPKALELGLIDKLMTSDDYLFAASRKSAIYQVDYYHKVPLSEKLSHLLQATMQKFNLLVQRFTV